MLVVVGLVVWVWGVSIMEMGELVRMDEVPDDDYDDLGRKGVGS